MYMYIKVYYIEGGGVANYLNGGRQEAARARNLNCFAIELQQGKLIYIYMHICIYMYEYIYKAIL